MKEPWLQPDTIQDLRPDMSPVNQGPFQSFTGYMDDEDDDPKRSISGLGLGASGKSSLAAALGQGPSMRSSVRLSTAQLNLKKRETLKLRGELSEAQVVKVNELLEDMLRNGIDFSNIDYSISKTKSLILKGKYSQIIPPKSSHKRDGIKLEKKITSSSKKTKHDPNQCINCEDNENTDDEPEPDSGVPDDPDVVFGIRAEDEERMDNMLIGNGMDHLRRNRSQVVRTLEKEEYKKDKNIKSTQYQYQPINFSFLVKWS